MFFGKTKVKTKVKPFSKIWEIQKYQRQKTESQKYRSQMTTLCGPEGLTRRRKTYFVSLFPLNRLHVDIICLSAWVKPVNDVVLVTIQYNTIQYDTIRYDTIRYDRDP